MPSRRPRRRSRRSGFELPHQPNLTGTDGAYRPGRQPVQRSGERPPATGDYQAWKPD